MSAAGWIAPANDATLVTHNRQSVGLYAVESDMRRQDQGCEGREFHRRQRVTQPLIARHGQTDGVASVV